MVGEIDSAPLDSPLRLSLPLPRESSAKCAGIKRGVQCLGDALWSVSRLGLGDLIVGWRCRLFLLCSRRRGLKKRSRRYSAALLITWASLLSRQIRHPYSVMTISRKAGYVVWRYSSRNIRQGFALASAGGPPKG